MEFYLKPIDGRKSFGNNAIVSVHNEPTGTISILKSYLTEVASYHHQTNKIKVNGWYSATTVRHINAFLDYYGFDTCTKKELENYKN